MAEGFICRRGGGGGNKSMIIVTAPAGSTVTCSNGTATKPCAMKDGKFVFRGCDIGSWTITSTKAGESPFTETIEITEENQMLRYYVTVAYRMAPEFTYTGNYNVVDDNDTKIVDFANWKDNWKIQFLTSGVLTFTNLYCWDGLLDVFLVGAGGGACSDWNGSGGGSGYTNTTRAVQIEAGKNYNITIGAGGAVDSNGGNTSAFNITANGGNTGGNGDGGDGGSGGGASGGNGGKDGADGQDVGSDDGGIGQHTTTREFEEAGKKLYSNGGSGKSKGSVSNNTGDGGGISTKGSSGIVVARNARAS